MAATFNYRTENAATFSSTVAFFVTKGRSCPIGRWKAGIHLSSMLYLRNPAYVELHAPSQVLQGAADGVLHDLLAAAACTGDQ